MFTSASLPEGGTLIWEGAGAQGHCYQVTRDARAGC